MKCNNNNSNEKEYNKKRKGGGRKNNSDAQCNCSPPADQCLSSDPPLPANSPQFIYWA